MDDHTTIKGIRLFAAALSMALGVVTNAEEARSIKYAAGPSGIIIRDLGLLPGGTASSGLAINDEPVIVGLATDSNLDLQRPFWDANTGDIVGFADNFNPAATAVPEHMNASREMAGTEAYSDNVYQGIYWNPAGEAFVLPPLAGFDPDYGFLHTRAHGINSQGQLVGTGKEGEPNFFTHAALWPDQDTEAIDLGFLRQGKPLNYSEAYGVNDFSHVVGNSAIGSFIHGFLWRNGQMTDLGALSGQVVSEAKAINNTGLIAGKSNIFPVVWEYDPGNPGRAPRIRQLPIPAGFFSATTTAVNDSGDVVGYAGSPNIDSHAILWRNGIAIDLGVWPGGHYSVANKINNLGQIVGTGTVAGDNLDHALMWTVDGGGGGIPCEDLVSFQVRCQPLGGGRHKLQARLTLTDTRHSGEQVIITVDGNPTPVTINGDRAQLQLNNPAPGEHTIELTDPAGCFPPAMPSCD
jgi:probable HAF family extracellular repeat protein